VGVVIPPNHPGDIANLRQESKGKGSEPLTS